uniref:Uncharacterized protein n=1 Tax=Zea mays TaxID=4577 RepID=A0A804NG38_MAIZE
MEKLLASLEASLEDHAGLLAAVAQADVVVTAMSGAHIRSHNLSFCRRWWRRSPTRCADQPPMEKLLASLEASLEDHVGLLAAVAQADVVVTAMSGAHICSHNLSLQHKLFEAIKEAGNIKGLFG